MNCLVDIVLLTAWDSPTRNVYSEIENAPDRFGPFLTVDYEHYALSWIGFMPRRGGLTVFRALSRVNKWTRRYCWADTLLLRDVCKGEPLTCLSIVSACSRRRRFRR